MTENRDDLAHNEIRFTISLGHIHEIFDNDYTTETKLIGAIRDAIVKAIAKECDLKPHEEKLCGPRFYCGNSEKALHDEKICYDFS